MSKPERRFVLEGYLVPGHHGAMGGDPVRLRELIRDTVEISVRNDAEAVLRKATKAKLKLDLPAMGQWRQSGEWIVFGTGPGLWSIMAKPGAPGAVAKTLISALGDHASVVESGHGLAFLMLSGTNSPHVLAKGCRLDLHISSFERGNVARTIIAQIPATLWRIDDAPTFGLAVPLTFAQSFVHFLLAASAETGCTILPASKD